MMPQMDGWQVLREVRESSRIPIIMLTARSEERDELLGFELGVDEYISKPFSPKILVARVEAILRRTNSLVENEVLKAGGIEINVAGHEVIIEGTKVELSYKEFELLKFLMINTGIVMTRESIMHSVWRVDFEL
jgi:DNA-binding response OmpR family regulator